MDQHGGPVMLNESQEVKDILRQLEIFQLHPSEAPRASSPLTTGDQETTTSIVSPCSSSASSHASQWDDVRHEEDQNELDHWSEEDEDGSEKHLCLRGARHFLDPRLFVPSTACDEETLRAMANLLQEAQVERERTRTWAEKMRKAVERWARVRMNVHTVAIQTLEDQLAEALQQCRRQEETIQQLEALVAKLESNTVGKQQRVDTNSAEHQRTASFQTPAKSQHGTSTLLPPTVSPPSPLSAGSASIGSSPFFDRRVQTKRQTPRTDPKSERRKRRIQKSGCEIIEYSNGATREIYTDHEVLRHRNKDVEIIYPDHSRYYYAESKTLRITDAEKTTYYYSNSQSEIHWNDGRKLIRFNDGTLHEVEHSIAATV